MRPRCMVVAPSFSRSEAISLNTLNSVTPQVAIGLHLGLTAPFRPLSKSFSPLREGAFLPLTATARHAGDAPLRARYVGG